MLEQLRVNIDSGYSCVDRSCPQVEQSGSAGPDKNDTTVDVFARNFPCQHLPGGDVRCLAEMAEFEIYAPASISGYFDVADADVIEARRLSERRLATRVRCLQHVGTCALGNAKRFCCERGHKCLVKPEHEREAANDLIAISYPVECTDSP